MSRALSAKSTLETLRKDAKRWLKALHAGDAAARRRLAAAWPQAPAEPALRDVQHALARDYGQDSWIALKAALDDLALERQSRAERVDLVLRHAWDGDPALARRILERDPSIARDSLFTAAMCGAAPVTLTGADAFRAAVLRHDEAEAKALLEARPELARDPRPLLAAAEFGDAEAVAVLLSLGADARATGHDGIGPLHRAVQSGSLKAVELLLAAGADIDLREQRWNGTPLTWSRVLGQPHLTAYLAPRSRDVRGLCWLGLTDRLAAVLDSEPALISHSLPGDENPTLLFRLPDEEAAAADVARILLAHGADPSVRNSAGKTAAEVALLRGLDEAADLIRPA